MVSFSFHLALDSSSQHSYNKNKHLQDQPANEFLFANVLLGIKTLRESAIADRQRRILEWLLLGFQKLKAKDIQIREAQSQLQELAVVQCCVAKTVLLTQWLEKRKGRADRAAEERNSETLFRKRVKKPTKEEVLELHAWVRGVFQHGRPSSGEVDWAVQPAPTIVDSSLQTEMRGLRRMTYPKLAYNVTYHQAPDEFRWLPAVDHRKKKKDVYLATIVSLLVEYDTKIARCASEDCEEVFLKVGRQKYHSDACGQHTHFKAWYGRDPEGAREKAGVRYRRMTNKKLQAKWKVGRRKKD